MQKALRRHRRAVLARLSLVVISLLAFAAIGAASCYWLLSYVDSLYTYRTPLRGLPHPVEEGQTEPVSPQVVLVIVSGLREDVSQQLPGLAALRQNGAWATMIQHPATYPYSTWTTLVTGAHPEISNAPQMEKDHDYIQPIKVDHLFAAAQRAGLNSGIVGHQAWAKLVSPEFLYTRFYVQTRDAEADAWVASRAIGFLRYFRPNLLVVQLGQLDPVGLAHGGASQEYLETALVCDAIVSQIASELNLRRSVLIVVGDHGHLDEGGRGGDEPVVSRVPFVMLGQGVRPGEYGPITGEDIAPTIAAILGTSVPSAANGHILFDMLDLDEKNRAEKAVILAEQRVRLANMYLYSIGMGTLSETAEGDALVARSSVEVRNYPSAYWLARFSVEQADLEMSEAREDRILAERRRRALPITIAVLLPLLFIWRARSRRILWLIVAATLSVIALHLLYVNEGLVYSLSGLRDLRGFAEAAIRREAIALLPGLAILLWQTGRDPKITVVDVIYSGLGFNGLSLYLLSLGLAVTVYLNGPLITWYLPDFRLVFVQGTLLLQAILVAMAGLVVPWLALVILWTAYQANLGTRRLANLLLHRRHT
ncbi:MAG: alkaline phosphatase family protein [Chloroflexi bacterium]|nr:alkaline phosphatase family protein [Chloroflexota bacterium]